jgi:thiamine-phosphate pyrophosphorylase
LNLFPDPLYPIADAGSRTAQSHLALAEAILSTGVRLLQIRIKEGTTRDFVERAREMKAVCDHHGAALIVNDRADIAGLVDAHGVHLGQEDLPPAAARQVLGASKWIGLSTHSLAQASAALAAGGIDYLAFGPIFATSSKKNPDPVQGLEALREVRRICPLPLVAIGGITRDRISDVLRAGADAVAVISAISDAEDPEAATRDLLQRAREARS